MKKKAHNLQFAVNDLFLFRIVGKCRLSVSEEYLVYFSCHVAESKRPSSAHRTKYKGICICFCSENWKHFVTRGVTVLLLKQYYPRHFDIQCKSLFPSSIPAHILQGQISTYFAYKRSKVQSLQPDWYTMWQLVKFSDDLLSPEDLANSVCSLNCMTDTSFKRQLISLFKKCTHPFFSTQSCLYWDITYLREDKSLNHWIELQWWN